MPVSADFSINTSNKTIIHQSGATVYTVNALYSFVQDYFDELHAMGSSVSMSAQTPTEYTLEDGWFIDELSLQYLNHGAIKTIGQDASIYSSGIYIVKFVSGGYVNASNTDIGKAVTDGTRSGILLAYDNTLRKWWIRRDIGTAWTGTVTITGGSGGTGVITSVATGEALYANIYTLGELESTTTNTLYIQQINVELTDNKITQFWGTGHIDILVKVKEAGTLIDNGICRVYCREYLNLFSHYKTDLSFGGRNPIPLSTLLDSNNQTSINTVSTWSDVTITFGAISRDIGDGNSQPYDAEIDCGTRLNLKQVYEYLKYATNRTSGLTINNAPGYFYKSANNAYLENLQAPFGTYAGGKFFGTRGIWLKNVPSIDHNNYQLLDSNNVSVQPVFNATLTLTNLRTGSEVRVYTGTDPATAVEIGGIESTSGSTFTLTHYGQGLTGFIVIFALGYQSVRYDNFTYSASDSLVIQQQVDRQYFNPI